MEGCQHTLSSAEDLQRLQKKAGNKSVFGRHSQISPEGLPRALSLGL